MSLHENKKRWLFPGFSKFHSLNVPCPKCHTGRLDLVKDKLIVEQDSKTKLENQQYISHFPDASKEYFSGFVYCSNTECKEPVAIAGVVNFQMNYDSEEMPRKHYRFYTPLFFFPPLSIIRVGPNCPEKIKEQIQKSFSHYFNDTSACANSMRTALELIMDDQGVRKTYTTKKGKEKYSLHGRIKLFGSRKSEMEPFLIAAKWIGNAGSHIGELNKEALLDGYELLEHCLDELYEKKSRLLELKSKAKAINKTKKPIKTK